MRLTPRPEIVVNPNRLPRNHPVRRHFDQLALITDVWQQSANQAVDSIWRKQLADIFWKHFFGEVHLPLLVEARYSKYPGRGCLHPSQRALRDI